VGSVQAGQTSRTIHHLANLLADQELVRYEDIRTYTSMSDDKLDLASAGYGAALRAFNVADWTQVTNIVSR
jgi:hypothetical protein